jgi:type IV pilus assembly protein PilC
MAGSNSYQYGTNTKTKGQASSPAQQAETVPPDIHPGKSKKPPSKFEFLYNRKITDKDILYLVDQLAIMFETGLNLLVALECLAVEAKNPAMRKVIENLRDNIKEGGALSAAMAKYPKTFSPVCINMVRAGEVSGNMDGMLRRLSEYLEREIETRSKIKSALSYPIVMLVMAFCVVAFLIIYVFPKFAVFFTGHEELLPAPTKFFLWLGKTTENYWPFMLGGFFAFIIGSVVALKREKVRNALDMVLLRIPMLGSLITKSSLSRSFHTLAVLLHGGIPILEALRLSKEVAGNYVFRKSWQRVSEELENGKDFASPLRENPYIPASETMMLSLGERSGHLSTVLGKLSKHYEREIDYAIKGLIKFVEPALIICMGAVVALIVMSLILPIFSISRMQG